jgi:formate dehydrogenase alpha subunit
MPEEITLNVDGKQITAKPGQTVIQAAMDAGLYIPYLCYWPGMKSYGACRMCVVEVEGVRGTPASCTLPAANGMVVRSTTPLVKTLHQGILELLLSEHPHGCLTCHRIELCGPQDVCLRHVRVTDRCVVCPKNERCELKDTVRFVGVNLEIPLPYNYRNLPVETGDPFYDRDYNLCIVCARCTRVCDEIRGDDAIAMVERSGTVLVGTSRGTSLLESGCEFCGACIDVCPVGALVEREPKWDKAVKTVTTTCTHCPVGCQVKLEVDNRDRVIRSVGDWSSETNLGQLCFKGKFGMEFVNHKERLTLPMVRRNGELAESTWEEALELIAKTLPNYRDGSFAMLVSPRTTNEDAYLAQKFTRVAMCSDNVDVSSNTRPEQVIPLAESLGFMAATGTLQELENSGCVLVVNSNITEDHNVAAVPIKKGRKKGTLSLVVIDTREVELTRHADYWLKPYPGTENILLAGLLLVVRDEGLENKEFVREQTEGWEALSESLERIDLGWVEAKTGVSQEEIREAARLFASRNPGAVLYALDNVPDEQRISLVQALTNLVLVTGNVGKPSSGLFPLRNGANEQGAWDVGCVPGFLPGYGMIGQAENREKFEEQWGAKLPHTRGLGVREIFEATREGQIRALQIVGDGPALDVNALDALDHAEFLIVHDLFYSDLAQRADVVLPLTAFAEQDGTYTSLDRRIQLIRPAVGPKGESQPLGNILVKISERMGIPCLKNTTPDRVMEEIASLVHFYGGVSHERLQNGGVQWPCKSLADSGTPHLYSQGFPNTKGRLKIFETQATGNGLPPEFPLLHAPGRVLAQPQEEVQVLRKLGRNTIDRQEAVQLHPDDALRMGISPGDLIDVITPVSRIGAYARLTGSLPGVVSTTRLFGELMSELDASSTPDLMLRLHGLEIMPCRLEKTKN